MTLRIVPPPSARDRPPRRIAPPSPEFVDLHDFRTSLTVLAGYLEMLSAGKLGPTTSAQRMAFDAMQRSVVDITGALHRLERAGRRTP